MFIDSCSYEYKNRSILKKTLFISLALHILAGALLTFLPVSRVNPPKAAKSEKLFIQIASSPALSVAAANTSPSTASSQPPFNPPGNGIPKPTKAISSTTPEAAPAASMGKTASPLPIGGDGKAFGTGTQTGGQQGTGAGTGTGTGSGTGIGSGSGSGTGSGTGSGSGSGGTSAGSTVADVRARFIQSLEKNKDYPYIARKQNQTGTVGIAVHLEASGNLKHVQVVQSSGFSLLDNAAVALVRKICPFAHNANREITLNININYDLEG